MVVLIFVKIEFGQLFVEHFGHFDYCFAVSLALEWVDWRYSRFADKGHILSALRRTNRGAV